MFDWVAVGGDPVTTAVFVFAMSLGIGAIGFALLALVYSSGAKPSPAPAADDKGGE